jgi:hypothetical protein
MYCNLYCSCLFHLRWLHSGLFSCFYTYPHRTTLKIQNALTSEPVCYSSAAQKIADLLWRTKLHHYIHKTPATWPSCFRVLGQKDSSKGQQPCSVQWHMFANDQFRQQQNPRLPASYYVQFLNHQQMKNTKSEVCKSHKLYLNLHCNFPIIFIFKKFIKGTGVTIKNLE